jgi:hypothetical protein
MWFPGGCRLAGERTWLALVLAAGLAVAFSRVSRQAVVPLGFAVGTALLLVSWLW